jgi:hypothetical protein
VRWRRLVGLLIVGSLTRVPKRRCLAAASLALRSGTPAADITRAGSEGERIVEPFCCVYCLTRVPQMGLLRTNRTARWKTQWSPRGIGSTAHWLYEQSARDASIRGLRSLRHSGIAWLICACLIGITVGRWGGRRSRGPR